MSKTNIVEQVRTLSGLRNRKTCTVFLLSYRNTSEIWGTRNAVGTWAAARRVFAQLFRGLPNFHECSLLLLENTVTHKRKSTCLLWSSKCKFSLLAPSLPQQLVPVLCFYRVIETWFKEISSHICFGLFHKQHYATFDAPMVYFYFGIAVCICSKNRENACLSSYWWLISTYVWNSFW